MVERWPGGGSTFAGYSFEKKKFFCMVSDFRNQAHQNRGSLSALASIAVEPEASLPDLFSLADFLKASRRFLAGFQCSARFSRLPPFRICR